MQTDIKKMASTVWNTDFNELPGGFWKYFNAFWYYDSIKRISFWWMN